MEATQKIQGVGKCGLGSAKGGERGLGRAEIRQTETDRQTASQTDRPTVDRKRQTDHDDAMTQRLKETRDLQSSGQWMECKPSWKLVRYG